MLHTVSFSRTLTWMLQDEVKRGKNDSLAFQRIELHDLGT